MKVIERMAAPLVMGCLVLVLAGCADPTERPQSGGTQSLGPLAAGLDSLLSSGVEDHELPGISVGVLADGVLLFTRDYSAGADNGSGDRVYGVASLSKPVAAWVVLSLVDRGLVALDDPVMTHLERWTLPDGVAPADSVTIRRVLSHTAGLSMPSAPWFTDESAPNLVQVLDGHSQDGGVRVDGPVGVWRYSGGGFALLEQLVADVTADPFHEVAHREVFAPLGMSRATFGDPVTDVAPPHDEEGKRIDRYRIVGSAAGGLHASVDDLTRLLGAYVVRGSPVLDSMTFEAMTAPVAEVVLDGVEGAQYGLGHGIHYSPDGLRVVYHSGSNPGYVAYMIVDVDSGDGVVVLSNSDRAIPLLVETIQFWAREAGVSLPPIY